MLAFGPKSHVATALPPFELWFWKLIRFSSKQTFPLNVKFGIIRALFKGNASDYGDAVLKLNNAASKTEMQHYLDLLQQRFGWDTNSEAYQEFSVYVERKMLTLEALDANADQ